ncbi:MAG: ATP-binding protein, partial [Propionivibrio sp.]
VKLLPGSLAARTVLLVIAIVAVAEITTFSLIFSQGRSDHLRRTADSIAGQIRLLQTVLPGLDEDARRRLEETDAGEEGLQLRPDTAAVPERAARFGFARRLAVDLGRRLATPVQLRHSERGRGSSLWIGFQAGGERWWLVLPPPRFAPPSPPRDLWEWLAVSLIVLMLIAGLFVRGIVRALARLGEAVAATGDGSARTVTPEGPAEVQRLALRHNTMLEQLAAAGAERQEMLAGLTHDLRAPMARLRVRLALLDNETERAGLTRDADDMGRIVTQFLDFLRSEGSSAEPAAPLLIADAVSDEVARQRELGRPVEMVADDSVISAQVAISPGNLQRVLDNLIDNALQHGAPPVLVSLALAGTGIGAGNDRAGTIVLRVRDHGPGIPVAQRARALDAFAQIDPARATRGSCGLGLAIVRRIVEACGGSVALDDAAGGGLEVALEIPLVSG